MPQCQGLAAAAKMWIVEAGMMLCVLKSRDWAGVLALGAHSDVISVNAGCAAIAPHMGFAAEFMMLLARH